MFQSTKHKLVPFFIVFEITFILLLDDYGIPHRTLFFVALILTATYPFWRREHKVSVLKTFLAFMISAFWLYMGAYGIQHSVTFIKLAYHTSQEQAIVFATPMFIVSFVFAFDELFIKVDRDHRKNVYIDVDDYYGGDLALQAKIKQKKANDEKLVAYSSQGELQAKKRAIELGTENCFVEFLSEKVVKKRID